MAKRPLFASNTQLSLRMSRELFEVVDALVKAAYEEIDAAWHERELSEEEQRQHVYLSMAEEALDNVVRPFVIG